MAEAQWPRENWEPGAWATGGMDGSFAGFGAARGWRRSGRFMASACATMLIVAAGLVFRKRTRQKEALAPPTQSPLGTAATAAAAAAAADALD